MILSSAGNCVSGLVGREVVYIVKRVSSLLAFLSSAHERRSPLPFSHLFTSTIFLKVLFSSLATNAKPLRPHRMESQRSSKRLRTSLKKKPKKIAIEGNIATGKSTFINMLGQESEEWNVVAEPVARWTNISSGDDEVALTASQKSGGNLLQMFYDDINRWSYTFQTYALLSRMRLQRKEMPLELENAQNPVQFFERSLYSDRYIFALNCFESGVMSETEWNIYQDWSTYLLHTLGELKLDGLVYLRATPEVCHSRMKKRGRPEEQGVTLDYLTCIHDKHEAWLYRNEVQMDETLIGVPILTIDCNEEFVSNPDLQRKMMAKVSKFVGMEGVLNDSGVEFNSSSTSEGGNSDEELF